MAADGKGTMGPPPRPSTAGAEPDDDDHDSNESGSDSGGSLSEPEPVLAVTRERRANAGSRMAQLLKLAGAEDEALGTTGGDEEEDGYADIFQEAADDKEFEAGRDEDADVDMSSSSEDDEDAQEGDEDAGERELRKEKKLEKSKKRKRLSLLQQTMKLKKLKYAPILQKQTEEELATTTASARASVVAAAATAAVTDPAPRHKKKVDRITWLPEVGGTRASGRKATVNNKQATHKRLKEHEKKRKQTLVQMQAAEQRRKANEVKPMTQEERLAHAAEIERENLNSVNHWEEAENQRQEERNAKLAALKNRKLEGPVISFWSGPAVWVNGKLEYVGKRQLIQDLDEEPQPRDASTDAERPTDTEVPSVAVSASGEMEVSKQNTPLPTADNSEPRATSEIQMVDPSSRMDIDSPKQPSPSPSSKMDVDRPQAEDPKDDAPKPQTNGNGDGSFLDGIEYWASLPPNQTVKETSPTQQILGMPHPETQTLANILSASPSANLNAMTTPSAPPTVLPPRPMPPPQQSEQPQQGVEEQNMQIFAALPEPVQEEQHPPLRELAARSLITLTSFTKLDQKFRRHEPIPTAEEEANNTGGRWGGARVSAAEKDRELLLRTLFNIPPEIAALSLNDPSTSAAIFSDNKYGYDPLIPASAHPRHNTRYLSKRAQNCAITGQVARYRDPATGLPYASAAAYKSVKKVLSGQGAWSSVLQCWVGEVKPAKGVPKSVWYGTKPVEKEVDKNKDKEKDVATAEAGKELQKKDGDAVDNSAK